MQNYFRNANIAAANKFKAELKHYNYFFIQ